MFSADSEGTATAGATPEQPLFFKWVRDEDGQVNWGRVLFSLGLTVLAAYLSIQTQRTAADPDFMRTLRMSAARQRITLGVRVQRAGKAIEDAGWTAYEQARG